MGSPCTCNSTFGLCRLLLMPQLPQLLLALYFLLRLSRSSSAPCNKEWTKGRTCSINVERAIFTGYNCRIASSQRSSRILSKILCATGASTWSLRLCNVTVAQIMQSSIQIPNDLLLNGLLAMRAAGATNSFASSLSNSPSNSLRNWSKVAVLSTPRNMALFGSTTARTKSDRTKIMSPDERRRKSFLLVSCKNLSLLQSNSNTSGVSSSQHFFDKSSRRMLSKCCFSPVS
mmetsp:Transcript_101353/g.160251  ORF Transcript_101353/g.160251 Transcript_101353/m.160251 type:complete len:231 (-) Transcript_101353:162-854(-)